MVLSSIALSKVEAAKLERSYRHAPKGAQQSTLKGPSGVCHLCMCGTAGRFLEWEKEHPEEYLYYKCFYLCLECSNLSCSSCIDIIFWFRKFLMQSPFFLHMYIDISTLVLPRNVAAEAMREAHASGCEPPWETEASFTRLLWHDLAPNGKQRFHRPDVWHTVLLGVGKQFVASAMSILQKALPERSIPARFQHLAHDYAQFCKENHHQKYVKEGRLNTMVKQRTTSEN